MTKPETITISKYKYDMIIRYITEGSVPIEEYTQAISKHNKTLNDYNNEIESHNATLEKYNNEIINNKKNARPLQFRDNKKHTKNEFLK